MKRTLAIALTTLALSVTAAQAESLPQPSFIDHVPWTAGDSNARGTATAISRRDMPQPSFVDYVAIETGDSSTGGSRTSMSVASGDVPRPSFVDYPDGQRSTPLHARLGYFQADRN